MDRKRISTKYKEKKFDFHVTEWNKYLIHKQSMTKYLVEKSLLAAQR